MGGAPDILFVIDTNKEDIAIKEANKLGIPVVAIVDSNSTLKALIILFLAMTMHNALLSFIVRCFSSGFGWITGRNPTTGVDVGAAEDVNVVIDAEPFHRNGDSSGNDNRSRSPQSCSKT